MEETGYAIKDSKYIGDTCEIRSQTGNKNISRRYVVHTTGQKHTLKLDADEKERGLTDVVLPVATTLENMRAVTVASYEGKFVVRRDLQVLEHVAKALCTSASTSAKFCGSTSASICEKVGRDPSTPLRSAQDDNLSFTRSFASAQDDGVCFHEKVVDAYDDGLTKINIAEIQTMNISQLRALLERYQETAVKNKLLIDRIIRPLLDRVQTIEDLGLGYLSPNRSVSTLSG